MCESCENTFSMSEVDRRDFLKTGAWVGTVLGGGILSTLSLDAAESEPAPKIPKEKARILLLFMYPPAEIVEQGKFEDNWAANNWFTYPGNQFQPEKNHRLFKEKVDELSQGLNLEIVEAPVVYTKAAAQEFMERVKTEKPDAVFVFNFYNTMSAWSYDIARSANEAGVSAVVYQPVGANHQLPPKALMNAEPGIYYIHSVRNWDQVGHALSAIHAKKRLSQTRLLRIGNYKEAGKTSDPNIGSEILFIPGEEFNALFDTIPATDEIRRAAAEFGKKAMEIIDVRNEYIVDGFRSYHAIRKIMERYGCDAITIRCLMLKERKPCIGFSILNSELTPCACEDNWDSALSLVLGSQLFGRGGFMHNPEYDINRNQYYGAHCTCALKMFGPDREDLPFQIRPFTHQAPKTAAIDVKMPQGNPAVVMKYLPGKKAVFGYTGKIVGSPDIDVAGGCATRFLMDVDKLENVCDMYYGPHPILYLIEPDYVQRLKIFAKLARLDWFGNV